MGGYVVAAIALSEQCSSIEGRGGRRRGQRPVIQDRRLPPTYRSTATILIEQQQIPQDLVRTTVTSFADQRVQVISQRIMTTVNLSRIIEQYGLYSEAGTAADVRRWWATCATACT
jgi:hypothetical protein